LVQTTLNNNTSRAEKVASLNFMIEIGAIKYLDIKKLKDIINNNSSQIPIPKSRVYLLSGIDDRVKFSEIKSELEKIDFVVLGAKKLDDDTRSNEPEIRYFNRFDEPQANKIVEVIRSRFPRQAIKANYYKDSSATLGYIEVWLGR
jgi:hypothetical protein